MKNTTYLTSVLLLALMLVLSSCKEKSDDDDNGGGNIPSNYRLVEWITYDDYQEEEKAIVTYNNNLIQTILGYDYQERGEWVENFKYEMSYPENNKAVVDLYSKENDLWVVYFTDVINYENGFVVECITYYNDNGNWIPAYRKTFSYNNNMLLQSMDYDYENGNWVEFYKADYEYNGSVLQKIYTYEREFDEWEPSEITSYQYQGGLVDLIYSLEYNAGTNDWDTTGTVGVEYAGGKVSKAIYMTHDMGAWIHDMDVNYQYDSHGNVISWNEIYQPDGDSWKIDFTYEAGAGNFRQLFAHKGYGEWGFWQPFPTKKSTHSSPFYRLDSETHRILIDYP